MVRSRFESIDLDRVSAPIFKEDPKCFFREFSRHQTFHKLGTANPLAPPISDLLVNSVDIGFCVVPAHFNVHQPSSVTRFANSEFQTDFDPSLGAFIDEGLMNLWILISVVDLCSTRRFDFEGLHQVFNLIGKAPRLQS